MPDFTIERLVVPTSLASPEGDDFVASVEVRNASEVRGYGSREYAYPAEQLFPNWLDPHQPKRLWVARDGSEPGGTIIGRGIHAPGLRLIPPAGCGSVAAGNREVRFLLARGYRLEQVTRASRFALPADAADLAARRADAEASAGADYVIHRWTGRTPERWAEDLAMLFTRMSTDAPSAGLEEPEDPWDVDRLTAREAIDAAGTTTTLTAVVEHAPTGRLAGYTQLSVPRVLDRPVSQDDTLVLREHRGHRLGMLLKIANLQALADVPPHPSVLTWNAEENRPMLDVNEAVAFVAVGYEGAWRLDLD